MSEKGMYMIRWYDAVSDPGQQAARDAKRRGPLEIRSVGFLVSRNKERIIIAQGRTENGDYVDTLTIPAGSVIEERRLRDKRGTTSSRGVARFLRDRWLGKARQARALEPQRPNDRAHAAIYEYCAERLAEAFRLPEGGDDV